VGAQRAFWSCFVCYGEPDVQFAKKLVADLEAQGVDCWLYIKDSTVGARTQEEIGQKRREKEKVIVLCSYRSLIQDGVLSEIDDQIREDPSKLMPVSLDHVWQHEGFLIMRAKRDLKPFLQERNYADFSEESTYDASLSKLMTALARDREFAGAGEQDRMIAGKSSPPRSKVLQRRVAGIASLLQARGEAKGFLFAPQILHELASVLALKYALLPSDELDEPGVHLKLIELMHRPEFLQTTLPPDLQDQGWSATKLLSFFEEAGDAVRRNDTRRADVDRVQLRLSQLYTLVEALVAEETDERAAEAKVQIALAPQESDSIEYKSSLRYNLATKQSDPKLEFEVIKAIAGLANHQGGRLYIGVSDKGDILGLEPDLSTFTGPNRNREDVFRRHFDELVTNYFGLANYQIVEPEWLERPEWVEPEGRKVFVVKVKAGSTPTFVKNREDGEFYVRRGARTMQLLPERFLEYYKVRWPSR